MVKHAGVIFVMMIAMLMVLNITYRGCNQDNETTVEMTRFDSISAQNDEFNEIACSLDDTINGCGTASALPLHRESMKR